MCLLLCHLEDPQQPITGLTTWQEAAEKKGDALDVVTTLLYLPMFFGEEMIHSEYSGAVHVFDK